MEKGTLIIKVYTCGLVYNSTSYDMYCSGRSLVREEDIVGMIRREAPIELKSRTTGRAVYIPFNKIDKVETEGGE